MTAQERLEICQKCEHLTKWETCRKCSCLVRVKVIIPISKCPVGKW